MFSRKNVFIFFSRWLYLLTYLRNEKCATFWTIRADKNSLCHNVINNDYRPLCLCMLCGSKLKFYCRRGDAVVNLVTSLTYFSGPFMLISDYCARWAVACGLVYVTHGRRVCVVVVVG